jgi:hypothetical protein
VRFTFAENATSLRLLLVGFMMEESVEDSSEHMAFEMSNKRGQLAGRGGGGGTQPGCGQGRHGGPIAMRMKVTTLVNEGARRRSRGG